MLDQIARIAREAGKIMLSFHDAATHRKEGHFNYVTDADVAVQGYLKTALSALIPHSRFFAEEQENEALSDAPTFVVDPIDGTLNYMRRRNCSAVSVALLENKTPVYGVIYNPYADELFSAEAGMGARLNGSPVRVSPVCMENAMVAFGTSPYDADLREKTMKAAGLFLRRAGDLRRSGSAALDLCDVACGRADVFFELRLRPWDVAAGSLIVTEAGGRFHSLGHAAPYYEDACGMLCANAACFDEALTVLEEALR